MSYNDLIENLLGSGEIILTKNVRENINKELFHSHLRGNINYVSLEDAESYIKLFLNNGLSVLSLMKQVVHDIYISQKNLEIINRIANLNLEFNEESAKFIPLEYLDQFIKNGVSVNVISDSMLSMAQQNCMKGNNKAILKYVEKIILFNGSFAEFTSESLRYFDSSAIKIMLKNGLAPEILFNSLNERTEHDQHELLKLCFEYKINFDLVKKLPGHSKIYVSMQGEDGYFEDKYKDNLIICLKKGLSIDKAIELVGRDSEKLIKANDLEDIILVLKSFNATNEQMQKINNKNISHKYEEVHAIQLDKCDGDYPLFYFEQKDYEL